MAQLNQLESLNCQLREQLLQHQTQMAGMQRNLEEEASRCQDLVSENSRLVQVHTELQQRSQMMSCLARPLTEELMEADIDQPEVDATLDDFQEISIPNTPTVLDGCSDVFEEHFKVLESLESYLETQHLVAEEVVAPSALLIPEVIFRLCILSSKLRVINIIIIIYQYSVLYIDRTNRSLCWRLS